MSDDQEDRIRAHAYALWEKEGRPQGRHDDHWSEAMAAVGGDGDTEHGIAPDDDMTASLIDHDPQVETPAAEPDMLPDILPPEPEGSEQTAPPAATDAETQSEAPAVTPEPAAPLSPVSAIRKSSAPRKPRGRKLGG